MAKKDFTGGLANLLSGADQNVTERQQPKPEGDTYEMEAALDRLSAEAEPEQTESAAPQMVVKPTTPQDETDLINSIDDPELREELKRRQHQRTMIGRGRPRKNTDRIGRRTDGYNRTSLIVPVDKWAKIKEIAFRETLTMKEIVELAIDMVIERYESKHGEVKPQQRKRDINEIF